MSVRRGDYGELSATARAHDLSPQALWQQRQVRAGHCARCGATRNRHGYYCDGCHETMRAASSARLQRLYDEGLCRCGEPRGEHRRCDSCLERERRARRLRAKRPQPDDGSRHGT